MSTRYIGSPNREPSCWTAREPDDEASRHLRGAVSVRVDRKISRVGPATSCRPIATSCWSGIPTVRGRARVRLYPGGIRPCCAPLRDLAGVFGAAGRSGQGDAPTDRRGARRIARRCRPTCNSSTYACREGGGGSDSRGAADPVAHSDKVALDLDRATPVVTYCASGARSMVAASVPRSSSISDVSDVQGGYGAWQDAPACPRPSGRVRTTASWHQALRRGYRATWTATNFHAQVFVEGRKGQAATDRRRRRFSRGGTGGGTRKAPLIRRQATA